jgi:hypothetical protein
MIKMECINIFYIWIGFRISQSKLYAELLKYTKEIREWYRSAIRAVRNVATFEVFGNGM